MPQVTGHIPGMSNCTVEFSTDAVTWTDISGHMNSVAPSGGVRGSGEVHTFSGDLPLTGVGRRGVGDVTVRVVYSEGGGEVYALVHNTFLSKGACYLRVTPSGSGIGNRVFTSGSGRVVSCPPPRGDPSSGEPVMVEFRHRCAGWVSGAYVGNGLLDGLVCFWPLSETSGNRADLHTNGYTLTDSGSVPYATGHLYTNAADFDMSADMGLKRLLADAALVNFGPADAFTLAAWTYPTAFTGGPDSPAYYRKIFCMGGASSFTGGYHLMTTANGQVHASIGATGGATYSWGWHVPDTYCTLNTWQLVIFAYDGPSGAAICRLNTTEKTDTNPNAAYFIAATGNDFWIGTHTGTAHVFDGRIGPAMIWNRVLSGAEMTALYNSGAGLAYTEFTS